MANKGDRIRLIRMSDDPYPMESGSEGVVTHVNKVSPLFTQISVRWDNGRSLMLLAGEDEFEVIPA